jgi:pimeloyl-ACP methyl ester carboxylesterase
VEAHVPGSPSRRCARALTAALVGSLLVTAIPACAQVELNRGELDRFDASKRSIRLSNGLSLAYIDLGPRTGQPVVLVHGYTDSARDWIFLVSRLSPRFRLIVVDLRGHGRSSKPECCYTRYDFAYDVKLLLDRLGIHRADMVGHSLGSIVAQTFAETWPERTGRVVLISSTGSGFGPRDPPMEFDVVGSVRALRDPISAESEFMHAWWASPSPVDEEFLHREREDAARIPARVWHAVLEQGLVSADLGSTLPELVAPALLLWGEKDPLMDVARRTTLIQALPGAEVRILPGLGHNPFWEDPERVASLVNEFLSP